MSVLSNPPTGPVFLLSNPYLLFDDVYLNSLQITLDESGYFVENNSAFKGVQFGGI